MWASGVLPLEVILAHFVTHLMVLCVQGGLVVLFALVVFKVPLAGSVGFAVIKVNFIIIVIRIEYFLMQLLSMHSSSYSILIVNKLLYVLVL